MKNTFKIRKNNLTMKKNDKDRILELRRNN